MKRPKKKHKEQQINKKKRNLKCTLCCMQPLCTYLCHSPGGNKTTTVTSATTTVTSATTTRTIATTAA